MNHPILERFPILEKELVEEIQQVAEIKDIKKGQVLLRTGQNLRSAVLVMDGLLKIFREDEEGNEYFIYYLDSGKACAITLVSAMASETSQLKAIAETDATVLLVDTQYVDKWLGQYKNWSRFIINSYRERFEELLQVIDHTAFRNMDERLLFYLKRYKEKTNSNFIATSFKDIGEELNSSREVISRLMKKLAERGMIKIHRSNVEILDISKAIH